jgi:hypothetical protein
MQGSARAALEIADDVLPLVGDDEGDADDVQNWMVNSWVWSATSNASCSKGEWRLETGVASGDDDGLVPLWVWTLSKSQWPRRRKRGRVRLERGAGILNRADLPMKFDGRFSVLRRAISPCWRYVREGKGRAERGDRGELEGDYLQALRRTELAGEWRKRPAVSIPER